MSGGVDSTSCALILKKQYNVTGFFMQLAQPDIDLQLKRVQEIASQLEIDLRIIDLQEQFKRKVLDYFSTCYGKGLTPNPCMVCNKEIKFGLFMNTILESGIDLVATGHYARIDERDGIFRLLQGKDPAKDQSYFLSRLTQEQLARVIFPLGDKKKEDIYTFTESSGFTSFRGQESQDVCFLGDENVGSFLEKHLPETNRSGPIIDINGRVLGQHQGLFRYTIGQRRGLGLPDATPWYVVGIKSETNSVVVGKNEDLFHDTLKVCNLHWISGTTPNLEREYQVRIRYSHRGSTATLKEIATDHYRISFSSSQRAVTPGQFAVIYNGDEVIGSGEIV